MGIAGAAIHIKPLGTGGNRVALAWGGQCEVEVASPRRRKAAGGLREPDSLQHRHRSPSAAGKAGRRPVLPDYMARTTPYYLDSVDKRLRIMSFIEGEPRLTSWAR